MLLNPQNLPKMLLNKLNKKLWGWDWSKDPKIKVSVRSRVPLIIEKYPFFKSLNEKLIEESLKVSYPNCYNTNVQGKMSDWNITSKNIEVLKTWISKLFYNSYDIIEKDYVLNFDEVWISKYDKGDFCAYHSHCLSWMSFVYFVKCPRGSAPLVLDGMRIKAEEGKLVAFPGITNHHVPKNRCNDRIVIAGNLSVERKIKSFPVNFSTKITQAVPSIPEG